MCRVDLVEILLFKGLIFFYSVEICAICIWRYLAAKPSSQITSSGIFFLKLQSVLNFAEKKAHRESCQGLLKIRRERTTIKCPHVSTES